MRKANKILSGFINPPKGYGEVSFFWWHGDDIKKDKLKWILHQLKDKHICGLQINYCHSDQGGEQYGLTMKSDPEVFSQEWWELVNWFIGECKKCGMAVSLSDYTLGAPGQNQFMDRVLEKHPEFVGQRLEYSDGKIKIVKVPYSANPMGKGIGKAVAEEFYGAFEKHFPGECGKGLNYFFSDELNFNIRGNLWSDEFADEFKKRKGYDICPKMEAIFRDIGPETPKIRMDYYDVIVQLSEEEYFRPIFEWHEKRNMILGCDHGGRGKDITEFGDYFRTMKWYQGPGNDQPRLESDIIKSKVSASIAHLYQRPRVWLEGFYSSGWDTSLSDVADAVFRNFALGHNLLSLHGLYYSMHGSMWEWAPPCNHFHMPYWEEMATLLAGTERMSYLLSQGVHCCDVAIIYPVSDSEADHERGKISIRSAFEIGTYLYEKGIDFDFIDFQSVERAYVENNSLCISGEAYKCIIIPEMRAVRFHMMEKLAEFAELGGNVMIYRQIPDVSDRIGRDDIELKGLTDRILKRQKVITGLDEIVQCMDETFPRDFLCQVKKPFLHHRKIEDEDLYYVYNVSKGEEMRFRTDGIPIILDVIHGKCYQIKNWEKREDYTIIKNVLDRTEPVFLFFVKDKSEAERYPYFENSNETEITVEGDWECSFKPTMNNRFGDYRLPVTEEYIQVETRKVKYKITDEDCSGKEYDDSQWEEATYGYGPYFWIGEGTDFDEQKLIHMESPETGFSMYEFSMKMGIEGDAGYQGSYHGLKGKVSDDFLGLGEKTVIMEGSDSIYEGEGPYYLFTTFHAEKEQEVYMSTGALKPECIWLNHEKVQEKKLYLRTGINYILLKYKCGGRSHFMLGRSAKIQSDIPLAMKWYKNPEVLIPDAFPEWEGKKCWYRFTAPPGTSGIRINIKTKEKCRVWADGEELKEQEGVYSGNKVYEKPAVIAVQILQERGFYGAAALEDPIGYCCGKGVITIGQTEKKLGIEFYSGGVVYEKEFEINPEGGKVVLNVGALKQSVQVWINGKHWEDLIMKPYKCDITSAVRPGKNFIRLVAHNTLHNHMKTIPTNFNQTRKRD